MRITKTFDQTGLFNASRAAEQFLRARGFSVGPSSIDGPQGILFGDFCISKWRNMNNSEILALHGIIRGEGREGPMYIDIYDTAPPEAIAAFNSEVPA